MVKARSRCGGASGVGTLKVMTGRLNAAGYVRLICYSLVVDGRLVQPLIKLYIIILVHVPGTCKCNVVYSN